LGKAKENMVKPNERRTEPIIAGARNARIAGEIETAAGASGSGHEVLEIKPPVRSYRLCLCP